MTEFFNDRLQRHQKQMLKYMRFVFNDHFVIFCTFLLGGIGLYYSDFVKTLPKGTPAGTVAVALVWLASLFIGTFVTLAKPADLVFLLPKESAMRKYLSVSLRYSCWLPFALLFLIGGFTMPLYVVSRNGSFSSFPFLIVMLWGLKYAHLQVQRADLFFAEGTQRNRLVWLLAAVVVIAMGLWNMPVVGMIGGLAVAVLSHYLLWQKLAGDLDWERMVVKERSRIYRIYRFINLFTDVPQVSTAVKRRKYLDGLLARIPAQQANTYTYLYARRLLRGTEYSGLYLRLLVIGGLLLAFIDQGWFSVLIGSLFIYLIGFQLVPVYNQFQYMVLTALYPVPEKQKAEALKKILLTLLLTTAVLYGIVSGITLSTWSERGLALAAYLVVAVVFCLLYLPTRLKKLQES